MGKKHLLYEPAHLSLSPGTHIRLTVVVSFVISALLWCDGRQNHGQVHRIVAGTREAPPKTRQKVRTDSPKLSSELYMCAIVSMRLHIYTDTHR